MADNGQEQSGSERLDRMEATLHMLINDHVQFREEHKMLLQSQVLLSGSLETLRDRQATLTADINKLSASVDRVSAEVAKVSANVDKLSANVERNSADIAKVSANVDKLSANVEAMRGNFDARLKRLES
jgi:SMC interacting uncharacterized protein involved in chromosome segregation